MTISVAGYVENGDVIAITLNCPTTGTAIWSAADGGVTTEVTGDSHATWTSAVSTNAAGCSVLTLTASGVATSTTDLNPTIGVGTGTGAGHELDVDTDGVTGQALSLSGTYSSLGVASSTFSVPSPATVLWYGVTANIPATTLGAVTTTAIPPISITQPANIPTSKSLTSGATVTLALPSGDLWAVGGSGTVSATGMSVALTGQGTGTLTVTLSGTLPSNWTSTSELIQLTGLSITTSPTSSTGAQAMYVKITANGSNFTGDLAGNTALSPPVGGISLGTILGTTSQIYGPDGTADGTVAQEFENAFPVNAVSSPPSGGNTNVVLATDVRPYDALSAAYLEGQLHTGLLITPPTSLGVDAAAAMRLEGVRTVYVVGGPLAIAPSVITQIEATPAYLPGGLTPAGGDIKVVGPIYGQTAADTAQMIATYFGNAYGSAEFAGAYTAASGSSGGGLYNDTTGTASTSGPTAPTATAIVLSDTDWQDAMSIAPESYGLRLPIILTDPSTLSTQASSALTSLGAKQVIVVGGQLALTNTVVSSIQALNGGISVLRIAGQDGTDTAAQLANFALAAAPDGPGTFTGAAFGGSVSSVLASHADYWSDALGAAPLGGGASVTFGYAPLILVQKPTVVGSYTTAELPKLAAAGVTKITVLGGPLAMPATTVSALQAGLAG